MAKSILKSDQFIVNTFGGFVRKIGDEGKEQTVEYLFLLSESEPDRHKTVIKSEAWHLENYALNNNVFFQHQDDDAGNTNPDFCIGHSRVWIEKKKLYGACTFEPEDINALAEKIRKKVDFGTYKAASVTFDPFIMSHIDGKEIGHFGDERKGENPNLFYFHDVDLLSWSIVHTPSLATATKRFYREALKEKNRNFLQKVGKSGKRQKSEKLKDFVKIEQAVLKNKYFLKTGK